MIRVDIHPDVRGKYIITVLDPGQPDRGILLSSTSQGYENAGDAEAIVHRLFGGPHPGAMLDVADADTFAAGGAGVPEPVELYVTYKSGRVRGAERLR